MSAIENGIIIIIIIIIITTTWMAETAVLWKTDSLQPKTAVAAMKVEGRRGEAGVAQVEGARETAEEMIAIDAGADLAPLWMGILPVAMKVVEEITIPNNPTKSAGKESEISVIGLLVVAAAAAREVAVEPAEGEGETTMEALTEKAKMVAMGALQLMEAAV